MHERADSSSKSLKSRQPYECPTQFCDASFADFTELENHMYVERTCLVNPKKPKLRQESQKGYMKRCWFSKFGPQAYQKISHNQNQHQFRLHLQELSEVTLPGILFCFTN